MANWTAVKGKTNLLPVVRWTSNYSELYENIIVRECFLLELMPLSNTGQMPNRVPPIKLDIQVSQPEDLDIYGQGV